MKQDAETLTDPLPEQSALSPYGIVGWRAWYAGGRVFDSLHTTWHDLPPTGVLLFVLYQRERKRRRTMAGVTLYWHDGADIYACDNTADADIPASLDVSMIKRGRWVSDDEYGRAAAEAFDAKEAPDESLRI